MRTSKHQKQLWFHWQRPTKSVFFSDLYTSEIFTLLTSLSLIVLNKWATSEHPELLPRISISALCFWEVQRHAGPLVQRSRSWGSTRRECLTETQKAKGLRSASPKQCQCKCYLLHSDFPVIWRGGREQKPLPGEEEHTAGETEFSSTSEADVLT